MKNILIAAFFLLPIIVMAQLNKQIVSFHDNNSPKRIDFLNDELKLVKYTLLNEDGEIVSEYSFDDKTGNKHGTFVEGSQGGEYNQGVLTAKGYTFFGSEYSKFYGDIVNGRPIGKLYCYSVEHVERNYEFREYTSLLVDYEYPRTTLMCTLNYNENGNLDGEQILNESTNLYFDDGVLIGYITWEEGNGNEFEYKATEIEGIQEQIEKKLIKRGILAKDSVFRANSVWKVDSKLMKNCGFLYGFYGFNEFLAPYSFIKAERGSYSLNGYYGLGRPCQFFGSKLISPAAVINEYWHESCYEEFTPFPKYGVRYDKKVHLNDLGLYIYGFSSIENIQSGYEDEILGPRIYNEEVFNQNYYERLISAHAATDFGYTWSISHNSTDNFVEYLVKQLPSIDEWLVNLNEPLYPYPVDWDVSKEYRMSLLEALTRISEVLKSAKSPVSEILIYNDEIRRYEDFETVYSRIEGSIQKLLDRKEELIKEITLLESNFYNSLDSSSWESALSINDEIISTIKKAKEEKIRLETKVSESELEHIKKEIEKNQITQEWACFDAFLDKLELQTENLCNPIRTKRLSSNCVNSSTDWCSQILSEAERESIISQLNSALQDINQRLSINVLDKKIVCGQQLGNSMNVTSVIFSFKMTSKPDVDYLFTKKELKEYWKSGNASKLEYDFKSKELRFYPDKFKEEYKLIL